MTKKQVYIFKAILNTGFEGRGSRQPYREIAILESQSLSSLARAIVTSFNFYFDHCYGFYDNFENPYKSKEIYELFTDLPDVEHTDGASGVTYVKVAKVFNTIGKKMRFLFDYGDNWMFTIELIGIKSFKETEKYPKIIGKSGKAPEQYPDLEEDDYREDEKENRLN